MNKIENGSKIKFAEEKQAYTVKATDGRYAICTKPFNLKKTVIYTVVDIKSKIRSTLDYIFSPYDYTKQSDINRALKDLQTGEAGLSRRNAIKLNLIT